MNTDKDIPKKENNFPAYPHQTESEDIYLKEQKTSDKDHPQNTLTTLSDDVTDLSERLEEVPGSELDDEQERIGSEDEENNYYSLGGDEHNNLEENQGE